MPDPEDPAAATARLESALDRIAALARRPAPVAVPDRPASAAVDVAALASRLDDVIARLRSALARPAGGETNEAADDPDL